MGIWNEFHLITIDLYIDSIIKICHGKWRKLNWEISTGIKIWFVNIDWQIYVLDTETNRYSNEKLRGK